MTSTIRVDPSDVVNGSLYSGRLSIEQYRFMPQRYRDNHTVGEVVVMLATGTADSDRQWIALTGPGNGLWSTADRGDGIPGLSPEIIDTFAEGWYLDADAAPAIVGTVDPSTLALHRQITRLTKEARELADARQAAEQAMRTAQAAERETGRLATQAREEAEACRESLAAFKEEVRTAVIAEAEERDWCGEVEGWLSDLGLRPWRREWRVLVETTVRTYVNVSGTTEEEAMAEVRQDLISDDSSIDFDPFRVKSPDGSEIIESSVESAEAVDA